MQLCLFSPSNNQFSLLQLCMSDQFTFRSFEHFISSCVVMCPSKKYTHNYTHDAGLIYEGIYDFSLSR